MNIKIKVNTYLHTNLYVKNEINLYYLPIKLPKDIKIIDEENNIYLVDIFGTYIKKQFISSAMRECFEVYLFH